MQKMKDFSISNSVIKKTFIKDDTHSNYSMIALIQHNLELIALNLFISYAKNNKL